MTGIRGVVLLSCLAFSLGFNAGFSHHATAHLWYPSSLRLATSLRMGLRSFVPRIFRLGRKGESGAEDDQGEEFIPPVPSVQEEYEPPSHLNQHRHSFEEESRGLLSRTVKFDGDESTQERINRVKAGRMTEEEKKQFLSSTLKASALDTKAKKLNNKLPLRQPLLEESTFTDPKNKPSATPFPRDSMLKQVVTGKNEDDTKKDSFAFWTESQKKKKQYFDMVTDPNRFHSFHQGPPIAPEPETPMPPAIGEDFIPATGTPEASDGRDNLSSRLGAYAHAEELRQQEVRRQVEQQRQEEIRKQAELQRKREEEMYAKEAANLQRKREAFERQEQEREERLLMEAKRQQEVLKAQEDYWAKKLAAERGRKLQQFSNPLQPPPEEPPRQQQIIRPTVAVPAMEPSRGMPQGYNQSNQEILYLYPPEPPAPALPIPAPPAPVPAPVPAPMSLNSPIPSIPTPRGYTNAFLDEQAARQAEIERAREDQLAKLKALNSPLPSGPQQGLTPEYPRPSPPTIPTMYRSPQVSRAPTLSQITAEQNAKKKAENDFRPVSRSLSVKDVMQQRGIASPAPSSLPVAPAPAPKSGGFMGGIFGGTGSGGGGGGGGGFNKPPPSQGQRKVVRQALPMTGDDDDEFDAFNPGGSGKQMSIKDAMRGMNTQRPSSKMDQEERSKMWGIDMSRFSE